MSSAKTYVQVGTDWGKKVLAGKVLTGKYIRLAVQRHFDDLKKSRTKDFPFKFDAALAERKLKIMQLMPHTKGEWAAKGKLIELEPWQIFGLMSVYGWVRKKDGFRRFRESYWEVSRKNGKSVIAAVVAIVGLVADGEYGAEVYCGATTEKQAWEVFRPARLMIKKSPQLIEAAGIEVNASNVNIPANASRLEPVIGNPGDGASPSTALIDEYHEHDTNDLYETMQTGMGARRQPLMFVITTAGYNIAGPCYDKRTQCIEMLEGIVPDDELFAYIWALDDGDAWDDPSNLPKSNPNMGISVFEDYLKSQLERAKRTPRFTNTFKTKHLNVWVSAKTGFFNLTDWKASEDKTLKLEQFKGESCVLSFDLASKLDLTCMARIFWREIDGKRHYYSVAPRFWVPYDTAYDSDNHRMMERLQAWVNSGHLWLCDGAEIDYRDILEEAKSTNLVYPVHSSPIDPHGAANLSHQLDDEGLKPITIIQNYTNMSDPMIEIEAALKAGRFHHDGNPIMAWCVGNVIGKNMPGSDDRVRPIKQGNDNKIDGAVSLIMGVGRIMMPAEEDDGDELNTDFVNW